MQHIKLFLDDNNKVINIEANIGSPILDTSKIPIATNKHESVEQPVKILDKEFNITAISWGNPHTVIFIDDVEMFDVQKYGQAIENKIDLFPNKTNVTFAQVIDRNHIKIREWERGTGETLGCGTGCCSATVAAVLTDRCDRHVFVEQKGGILETNWNQETGTMFMKGPAYTVFESDIDVSHIINKNRVKNLKSLLENVEYELIKGKIDDVEIEDIKYDSRKVEENDLFVARTGTSFDSHLLISDAINKGANVIVIERDIEIKEDVTVIKVKSSKEALAIMSANYFNHPAEELTTIGITGTAGKTSSTYMLKAILEKAGNKVGLIGTTGAFIGNRKTELHNTTPESYEIQKLFREMVDQGCKYAVMEVSSQGLKMNRVDGFTFDYGVFTNISKEHIGPNEHENFEEYLYCKSLLFRKCKVGIINIDDERWQDVIKDHTCKIIKYGIKNDEADIRATNIEFISDDVFSLGMGFDIVGKIEGNFKISVSGRFSVYNSLCAITVANELGISIDDMRIALKNINIKGRIELVSGNDVYKVIVDYAHNENEMNNLMDTISEYKPKRLICIFGCGGNRSVDRRYAMGEVAGKWSDLIILTEDNPRYEDMRTINNYIITGINKSNGKYIIIDDRKEAIKYAIKNAQKGDIILLIGKGHEQYQEIKGVKYFWDEGQAVKEVEKEILKS